jgi:hypothetical protein
MLNFTGKELGNIYIEESGLSLVRCNHYEVMEDNTSIGTFFSGCRHSGEKYFSLTRRDENLTIRAVRKSIFKKQYQILEAENSKSIGYFEYSPWEWLNPTGGMMSLTNGEVYHFKEVFGILTNLWQKHQKFAMRSETIKYSGEFKIDDAFSTTITGVIETEIDHQTAPAILGLFFIDSKFRKWIQNNID